jgi:tetratricopeptide (TPR) repeat protein
MSRESLSNWVLTISCYKISISSRGSLRSQGVALRPSRGYRLSKFVRRNRGAVIAASLVLLALVGGVVGTTIGLIEARAQRNVAEKALQAESLERSKAVAKRDQKEKARSAEAEQHQLAEDARKKADEKTAVAKAVNDFLQNDLLSEAAPEKNPRDKKVTVEELLDKAASRIDGKFAKQPLIEAAVRRTIGSTYVSLGNLAAARPHIERALEIRRRILGADHADTLDMMNDEGLLLKFQGKYAEAESLYLEALRGHRRVL